jgi:tRNA modification GTPase
LLRLCSLLELELDFSEEDVEFADRSELKNILDMVEQQINYLCSSFTLGNAIKNGVSVAIIGEPNVGKSTLLNRLIGDDCAMVSDIAGTTRDTIEATTIIDGIRFRFVDTAGLRTTDDRLEQMGIERTYRAISKSHIVLHLTTAESPDFSNYPTEANPQAYIRVVNKIDKSAPTTCSDDIIYISAKADLGIDNLRERMRSAIDTSTINSGSVVVSNMRHYEALTLAREALGDAQRALDMNLSGDLISEDIRRIIHHLGEITGDITSDDILQSIFSKFCIVK